MPYVLCNYRSDVDSLTGVDVTHFRESLMEVNNED